MQTDTKKEKLEIKSPDYTTAATAALAFTRPFP